MLLAPDLRVWLAVGHVACWADDLVQLGLGLSAVYPDYIEVRGAAPYDPRLMLKILICGYSYGITSSRALEWCCYGDIAFRSLTVQAAPDFVAISRFRARHGAASKALFTQSLALCARAGRVSLGRVALDGTKVRAAVSRYRPTSNDRMVRAEFELAGEVDVLLARRSGWMRLRTPCTVRTAVSAGCWLSWPAGRAGWSRSGWSRLPWRLSTPRRPARRLKMWRLCGAKTATRSGRLVMVLKRA